MNVPVILVAEWPHSYAVNRISSTRTRNFGCCPFWFRMTGFWFCLFFTSVDITFLFSASSREFMSNLDL